MDETDILKERKERILAYMESEGYVPIKRRDMRAMLSVPQEDREKFESLINELLQRDVYLKQRRVSWLRRRICRWQRGHLSDTPEGLDL